MEKLSLPTVVCIVFLFYAASVIASPAQVISFTTLYSFCSQTNCADGSVPEAGLVQATDGNFYGTTTSGGTNNYGTVFKISAGGALTTLHSFNYTDGSTPEAGLVQATDGNLYGTTNSGGDTGNGTVFQITLAGALTTLYSFCSQPNCTDGGDLHDVLVQATDKNLYGTTTEGGTASQNCPAGCGTVFKITLAGALTTLYRFCAKTGCADGAYPTAGLVQATDGNLYGTAYYGGAGCGTVFKITTGGALTTLYSFCSLPNRADGAHPDSGLVQATDKNLYGTTVAGGAGKGGTVFKITTGGALTTLYSFCSQPGCTDGAGPEAGPLVQATDGNFYGTTIGGGVASNEGTVFKITAAGALTTLYSFCSQPNCTDGGQSTAGLVQFTCGPNARCKPDRPFYGTTSAGGANGEGTVFSLSN